MAPYTVFMFPVKDRMGLNPLSPLTSSPVLREAHCEKKLGTETKSYSHSGSHVMYPALPRAVFCLKDSIYLVARFLQQISKGEGLLACRGKITRHPQVLTARLWSERLWTRSPLPQSMHI